MREGKNRLQIGALLLGVGLSLSVAAPALAQETASAETPDGGWLAVADSTQSYIAEIVEVDPQTAFSDAFLACEAAFDVDDCVQNVMENAGLETPRYDVVDNTPLNPNDVASDELVNRNPATVDASPPGL